MRMATFSLLRPRVNVSDPVAAPSAPKFGPGDRVRYSGGEGTFAWWYNGFMAWCVDSAGKPVLVPAGDLTLLSRAHYANSGKILIEVDAEDRPELTPERRAELLKAIDDAAYRPGVKPGEYLPFKAGA
jgi:hypothetical protein